MKKFLFFLLVMFSVITSASAQTKFIPDPNWKPHVVPTIYGGYNFSQKSPVMGVAVPIYVNFVRGEFDFSYTHFNVYNIKNDIKSFYLNYGKKKTHRS